MIGLKFLLRYGQFLEIPMTLDRARDIMRKFSDGTYSLQGPSRIGEQMPDGSGWFLDTTNIVGIHTFPLPNQPNPNPPQATSGVAIPLKPWQG